MELVLVLVVAPDDGMDVLPEAVEVLLVEVVDLQLDFIDVVVLL